MKLFRFSRNVGKNMLVDPINWRFIYKFMIGKQVIFDIHFSGSEKVYRLVKNIEKPFWWLKRRLK